jgi:acylphosphatase
MERREIHYFGRVQGVGFRYQAREVAQRHPVTGFVENLFDGRVRLVIEGEPAALDQVLLEIDARLGRNIEGRQTTTGPATGEFSDFQVRH